MPFDLQDHIVIVEECWIWTGAANYGGYGLVKRQRRVWLAHRWAWMLTGQSLPEQLHHTCGHRRCVNPDHL